MTETTKTTESRGLQLARLTNRRYHVEMSKTVETESSGGKKIFLKMVHGVEADVADGVAPISAFATLLLETLQQLSIMEGLANSRHFTKDLTSTEKELRGL